jgi:hypothetical protein
MKFVAQHLAYTALVLVMLLVSLLSCLIGRRIPLDNIINLNGVVAQIGQGAYVDDLSRDDSRA